MHVPTQVQAFKVCAQINILWSTAAGHSQTWPNYYVWPRPNILKCFIPTCNSIMHRRPEIKTSTKFILYQISVLHCSY